MKDTVQLYELGYHVVPVVGDDGLQAEVEKIKKVLEGTGATITDTTTPEKMDLAYRMECDIDRKRHKFDEAYFGFVVFTGDADALPKIEDLLNKEEHILRFMLIKTTQEELDTRKKQGESVEPEVVAMNKAFVAKAPGAPAPQVAEAKPEDEKPQTPEEQAASKKQIDEEIDKLIVE